MMIENEQKTAQVAGLDGFAPPDYSANTIANIPATVAALLGAPFVGLPPLRPALWEPVASGVRRVVLFVVDALGLNLVEQERPFLTPLLRQAAIVDQITSVFPSTTVAALSSLWTGVAPAQHGMVGLNLFFPEYGVVGQTLNFSPAFGKYPDALVDAGLDPAAFLHGPGFAEQLAADGAPTYAFKGYEIVDSVLSRMHGRGVKASYGVVSVADMLVQMRELLERQAGERLFVSGYWPSVDTLSHRHGWRGTAVAAELRAIFHQLQTEFLAQLSPAARRDTLLLVTADHGQVHTPPDQRIYLEDYPDLAQMLLMPPTGEPRVAYLYARQGCVEAVVEWINNRLGAAMQAWRADDALAAGLLGPPPHAPQTRARVGDVVAAMRAGYILLTSRARDAEKADKMVGRHGGMTAAEMQAPWLAFRLDG